MNTIHSDQHDDQHADQGRPGTASSLGELDLHLFGEGTHRYLHRSFGARPTSDGTRFAVWAPNATAVSVAGSFDGWAAPRELTGSDAGVWSGWVDGAGVGDRYLYRVTGHDGTTVEKSDPLASAAEEAPAISSIIADLDHEWGDDEWMASRGARIALDAPVSIYELHLGSWGRHHTDGRRFPRYDELADPIADHMLAHGFTHVELLPIMEHPFYGSWGYQTTGFFAPTSRYGSPTQLMTMIDRLHQRGVGVILDWVPSHFPTDTHGLYRFDGTHLFEHADPRQGYHPDWNSAIFNYRRNEVRSFLVSSAMCWLDRYHVDALRVDAVASMLYLDYSRNEGEWIPNEFGGRENLDAITFLRQLNEAVYGEFPDTATMAEESTSWPMVSRPTYVGGLGFGNKWDMGWMHDTLAYFEEDPINRRWHHDKITFRSVYSASEHFVLPLSHDEVVHGKGSLLEKMPGDDWQQFANLRLLYAMQWAQPGKKLLFMGGELATRSEWNHDATLDWELHDAEMQAGVRRLLAELNGVYSTEPALHRGDSDAEGMRWIVGDDRDNSVYAWLRLDPASRTDPAASDRPTGDQSPTPARPVLVVFNATPTVRHNYRLGVPTGGRWDEIVNTDAAQFAGSGVGNGGSVATVPVDSHGFHQSIVLTLPPLGALFSLRPRTGTVADSGADTSGAVADPIEPRLGATPIDGSTRFEVWAPTSSSVEVVVERPDRDLLVALARRSEHDDSTSADATWTATVDGVGEGDRYRYRLDGGEAMPDPASRLQPDGVHGPSAVVDVAAFDWTDNAWTGVSLADTVLYELHIGTFTRAGTFDAAIDELDRLVALGVTAVEIMPVAAFSGERNWGYDGVFPFATQASYGGPAGLARLVDAAHARGLAVVLDVVYNHFGPEGNVLPRFGPYLTDDYSTPWGGAVNVSGRFSDAVRRFLVENAVGWIRDFHLDGLRLDAVHAIVDPTARPFVSELTAAVHRTADELGRTVLVTVESSSNDPRIVRSTDCGGWSCDGVWNDDFHHALRVALTGERHEYYAGYAGAPDVAAAFEHRFVYRGQHSTGFGRRHGADARDVDLRRFIVFAQNHDHVGNTPLGERMLHDAGPADPRLRLAAAAVLLSPFTPMLFMGEEYGERAPFPYFVDHGDPELVEAVRAGRRREFSGVDWAGGVADPAAVTTFESAVLHPEAAEQDGAQRNLLMYYTELLRLRRAHRVLTDPAAEQEVEEHSGVIVLRRRLPDATSSLILNFTDRPHIDSQSGSIVLDSNGQTEPAMKGSSARLRID